MLRWADRPCDSETHGQTTSNRKTLVVPVGFWRAAGRPRNRIRN